MPALPGRNLRSDVAAQAVPCEDASVYELNPRRWTVNDKGC